MTTLAAGESAHLGDPGTEAAVLEVSFEPGPVAVDVMAFVCDSSGMVVSDQHFIFHSNKATPERSVFLREDRPRSARNRGQLLVDMMGLPDISAHLDVVLVAPVAGQTLEDVAGIDCRLWSPVDGSQWAAFTLDRVGVWCNVLRLGRIRRTRDRWMFTASGEPYDNDFVSLIRDYGVHVS